MGQLRSIFPRFPDASVHFRAVSREDELLPDIIEQLREALAGQYVVERELGRGGMATVYLAADHRHDRKVAIKLLDPELAKSMGADRFLREIQLAAKLQHPHILPLYDSGVANGLLYYVMPFVEGETLRDKMTREKQLSLDETFKITSEVASALSYAHSRGIVHRDIKPENIMLSAGTAVVADFGIARALDAGAGSTSLTQTGTIIGTPQYMSPEQGVGSTDIDGRSDQYSLACVVYEMLVGEPPFTGPNPMAVIARHSMDMVSPPTIVRSTIPDATEDALLQALAKVPADRFATVSQFAEALTGGSVTTSGRHSQMARASMARASMVRRSISVMPAEGAVTLTLRRRSLAVFAYVAAAIVLVASGAWFFLGRGGRGGPTAGTGLDPRTIAVLYFSDLSPDGRLGYVADGFTEALIDQLSRVPGLSVISRSGAAAWRDAEVPPDSIGRALRAGTLVQGRVEPPSGDRIRVQVWLVDGNSGADLGKRASFERPASDLVGARDSLAAQAGELIRQQLGEEFRLRRQQEGTQSTAAWSLLQQAEVLIKRGEAAANGGDTLTHQKSLQSADSLLAAAASLDASWPDPVVERGRVAYLRSRRSRADPIRAGKWIDLGLVQAEQALALAANNADALELRGNLQYWKYLLRLEQDSARAAALRSRARADFEEATRIRPTQAGAWSSLSHLYYNDPSTSPTDVMLAARRAYESDAFLSNAPVIIYRLFIAAFDLDQEIDADRWCAEGFRRFPRESAFTLCQIYLMTMRNHDPDVNKAWELAGSEALTVSGQTGANPAFQKAVGRMWVAAVLGKAGLKDSARAVAKSALAGPEVDPTRLLYFFQAIALTFVGDHPAAVGSIKTFLAANPERRGEFADPNWYFKPLAEERALKDIVGR